MKRGYIPGSSIESSEEGLGKEIAASSGVMLSRLGGLQQFIGKTAEGKQLLDVLLSLLPHAISVERRLGDRFELYGELVHVMGVKGEACHPFDYEIGRAACSVRDEDGKPCGHGFVDDEPPSVLERRVHEGTGSTVVGREVLQLAKTAQGDAVEFHFADLRFQFRSFGAVSDQQEAPRGGGAPGVGTVRSE